MIGHSVWVRCEGPSCRKRFTMHGTVTADALRQAARWKGWSTPSRGDFCPEHRSAQS